MESAEDLGVREKRRSEQRLSDQYLVVQKRLSGRRGVEGQESEREEEPSNQMKGCDQCDQCGQEKLSG